MFRSEAADDLPQDFTVLKRAKIHRSELVPLQMRSEAPQRAKAGGGMLDGTWRGKPILGLSADGTYLEFLEGCTAEESQRVGMRHRGTVIGTAAIFEMPRPSLEDINCTSL
eukprot:Skav232678  [mRNA]  locus=scaffold698:353009:355212:+ [translate_table: standard]